MKTLDDIAAYLRDYAQQRDWQQFHSPKNLAMALTVEAGELMEHFQWLTDAESREINGHELVAVADEIADVQLYLIRLADQLGIDIFDAVREKTQKNERKYPVEKCHGSAKKYTYYQDDDPIV